jgi:hypothetical protein
MNVKIEAEAALFPEKEYINGIFVAVWGVLENGDNLGQVSPKYTYCAIS